MRIETRDQIKPVLAEAFACGKPVVVDCVINYREKVFPFIPPGGGSEDMIFSDDVFVDQM